MTQRTSTVIAAELAQYRDARAALVKGDRVESVNRDGRGMRLASMNLADINTAIRDLEREYDQAVAVESGDANAPRRTGIGLRYI
jgi:hypothetical protein